jgi:hypothetical protein
MVLVGMTGLEPATSRPPAVRASQLRHIPLSKNYNRLELAVRSSRSRSYFVDKSTKSVSTPPQLWHFQYSGFPALRTATGCSHPRLHGASFLRHIPLSKNYNRLELAVRSSRSRSYFVGLSRIINNGCYIKAGISASMTNSWFNPSGLSHMQATAHKNIDFPIVITIQDSHLLN